MNITLTYYVTFGPGDSSEWLDWEVELTPEEESAYRLARKQGQEPDEVPELADVLSRAYDEILEAEEENFDSLCDEDGEDGFGSGGWRLEVFFPEDDDEDEDEED